MSKRRQEDSATGVATACKQKRIDKPSIFDQEEEEEDVHKDMTRMIALLIAFTESSRTVLNRLVRQQLQKRGYCLSCHAKLIPGETWCVCFTMRHDAVVQSLEFLLPSVLIQLVTAYTDAVVVIVTKSQENGDHPFLSWLIPRSESSPPLFRFLGSQSTCESRLKHASIQASRPLSMSCVEDGGYRSPLIVVDQHEGENMVLVFAFQEPEAAWDEPGAHVLRRRFVVDSNHILCAYWEQQDQWMLVMVDFDKEEIRWLKSNRVGYESYSVWFETVGFVVSEEGSCLVQLDPHAQKIVLLTTDSKEYLSDELVIRYDIPLDAFGADDIGIRTIQTYKHESDGKVQQTHYQEYKLWIDLRECVLIHSHEPDTKDQLNQFITRNGFCCVCFKRYRFCPSRPKPWRLGDMQNKSLKRAEYHREDGTLVAHKMAYRGYRFCFTKTDGSVFLFESGGWNACLKEEEEETMLKRETASYRFLATEPDVLLTQVHKGEFSTVEDPGLFTLHFTFQPQVWGRDSLDIALRRMSDPINQ
jgi:hypothetical protein